MDNPNSETIQSHTKIALLTLQCEIYNSLHSKFGLFERIKHVWKKCDPPVAQIQLTKAGNSMMMGVLLWQMDVWRCNEKPTQSADAAQHASHGT